MVFKNSYSKDRQIMGSFIIVIIVSLIFYFFKGSGNFIFSVILVQLDELDSMLLLVSVLFYCYVLCCCVGLYEEFGSCV